MYKSKAKMYSFESYNIRKTVIRTKKSHSAKYLMILQYIVLQKRYTGIKRVEDEYIEISINDY